MQNLLLGGELLPEVIASLVFFEQAQWFMATLTDEQPRVSPKELASHASGVVDVLQRLIEANSCSFVVSGDQPWHCIWPQTANPAKRLATVASALASQSDRDNDAWLTARISDLAARVEAGKLSPSFFVEPIKALGDIGCLTSEAGKRLVLALARGALSEPQDIDDFETLAGLVGALPESFTESELDAVREAYSEFADRYAADCDLRNPEELRGEASRVGDVGDLLQVDTDAAQEVFRESADEIEEQQASRWEDDEDRGGGHGFDMCSDKELDSMFGTLKS